MEPHYPEVEEDVEDVEEAIEVTFLQNFDHIIQFNQTDKLIKHLKSEKKYSNEFINFSGHFPPAIKIISSLISKCLGKRILHLDYELVPRSTLLQLKDSKVQDGEEKEFILRFGLVIDQEISNRVTEKCESETDETTITEFKEFWGAKSELRRFKDGSICEAVIFEEDKSRVCYNMIKFIFSKHLGYQLEGNEYLDGQLGERLEKLFYKVIKSEKEIHIPKANWKGKKKLIKALKAEVKDELIPIKIDEISILASNSFDDLAKKLRQLEELPLKVTSVQGTSSILRFTNVSPTPPQRFFSSKLITESSSSSGTSLQLKEEGDQPLAKSPKYVQPICVLIQLETSGKWPEDLEAIEKLKCAFLIRIGELLSSQFDLKIQVYLDHLIVLKDGFVFRIEITYFRELTLLKQIRGKDGVLRVRDNPTSTLKEKNTLILPQLTSTLHSFNLEYPAFGKTCRIAKRWVSSQLLLASSSSSPQSLDVRFTEEAVELLVASLFIDFKPYTTPPHEAQAGFLRFLTLLESFNWEEKPLIINFHEKLTPEEIQKIQASFDEERSSLPPMFISTPEDKLGSVWTKDLSRVALSRARDLARNALEFLSGNIFSKEVDSLVGSLFSVKMDHFDLIISIKKEMNPKWGMALENEHGRITFVEYAKTGDERIPIIDFDPMQKYIEELRSSYSHLALFLNEQFGGNCIGVMWKPEFISSLKKLSRKNEGDKSMPDIGVVIESFRMMGEGLVENIKVQSENWDFNF